MEPLKQQLPVDSFSYGSLDDGLRSSLDAQDASSFIEMDPRLISKRWKADSLDFDFGLPGSQSPVLVHADQVFSNGLLLPLHLLTTPPQTEVASNSTMRSALIRSLSIDSSKSLLSGSGSNRFGSRHFYTVPSSSTPLKNSPSPHGPVVQGVLPTSSSSSSTKGVLSRGDDGKLHFLGGCTKSSKKFFQRCLKSLLTPMYKKFKGLKSIRRAVGSRASSTRSCMESIGASPRTGTDASSSFKFCHGRRTCGMGTENEIHDAVLHCKNSISN